MTPEKKQMIDMDFEEITKHEVAYLEGEGNGEKNEHGAYIYQSTNHSIRLDLYLNSYKQWLIENNIVKEI